MTPREEGKAWARENGFFYKNHYPTGSKEHSDYEDGWKHECSINPKPSINLFGHRRRVAQLWENKAKREKVDEYKVEVDAYRRAKGE